MKKQILQGIYSIGGFRPFHFLNRNKILILTYHRFSAEADEFSVSAAQLEAHLKYLKERHHIVSLDDAVSSINGTYRLPSNPVVITIDDGYFDAYEIAYPLLQKHSVPATLFAITDFLDGKCWLWTDLMRHVLINTSENKIDADFGQGRTMSARFETRSERIRVAGQINEHLKKLDEETKSLRINEIAISMGVELPSVPTTEFRPVTWDQALEMDRNGVRIESHTISHPILTNVDAERLSRELIGSKSVLNEKLGREVRQFCYPNGSFDESVRKAVVDAGYQAAVTTNYGFCGPESEPFTLKRIDSQPAISSFAQSVSGFESFRDRVGI